MALIWAKLIYMASLQRASMTGARLGDQPG
jgi:hypothetical protein